MPTNILDPTPTAVAAIALVTLLGIVRTYAGPRLLSLQYLGFWGAARRIYMPIVDKVAKQAVGVSAENHATREEHVYDTPASPQAVANALQDATTKRFEVSVLSGLKSDWDGNTGVASAVAYDGAKPFPGAPFWLRPYQVHVFMFELPDGNTRVCAHFEANAWRPDQWRDHLRKGASFSAEKGVRLVIGWLTEAFPQDA